MAKAGLGSRRKCEEIILAGLVTVDGTKASLGLKADPEINEIKVNNKPIRIRTSSKYILLNKPSGYICTKASHKGERTVMELVNDQSLFPVGRLDKNTTGLLLLTNDGDFANSVMHPSAGVEKKYQAYCLGRIPREKLEIIRNGVVLDGRKTKPCSAAFISYNPIKDLTCVEISIHEGRNRQVRRMFASIGHDVKHLSRIRVGELDLRGVKEGSWRYLTASEVNTLKNACSQK